MLLFAWHGTRPEGEPSLSLLGIEDSNRETHERGWRGIGGSGALEPAEVPYAPVGIKPHDRQGELTSDDERTRAVELLELLGRGLWPERAVVVDVDWLLAEQPVDVAARRLVG